MWSEMFGSCQYWSGLVLTWGCLNCLSDLDGSIVSRLKFFRRVKYWPWKQERLDYFRLIKSRIFCLIENGRFFPAAINSLTWPALILRFFVSSDSSEKTQLATTVKSVMTESSVDGISKSLSRWKSKKAGLLFIIYKFCDIYLRIIAHIFRYRLINSHSSKLCTCYSCRYVSCVTNIWCFKLRLLPFEAKVGIRIVPLSYLSIDS